jgi:hypothetical protein
LAARFFFALEELLVDESATRGSAAVFARRNFFFAKPDPFRFASSHS